MLGSANCIRMLITMIHYDNNNGDNDDDGNDDDDDDHETKILLIDDDPSHLDAIDTQQLLANIWFQTELGKAKLSGKCFKHFRLTAN